MSGLCGIISFGSTEPDRAELMKMCSAASHRGLDGITTAIRNSAAIGYLSRRITPESERETQPLIHEPTGIVLAADVRIDNRYELLESPSSDQGLPVSDAEILLQAYLEWDAGCFARILGDFACAIWDPRQRRLLLARDAMGMRPLYYWKKGAAVLFASEIKQIVADRRVSKRINEQTVAAFIAFTEPPLDRTYYDGISQVRPGEEVSIVSSATKCREFWSFDPGKKIRYRNEAEYVGHLKSLFQQSVNSRIRGIYPIGISLSGGLDSGAIASFAGLLREQGPAGAGNGIIAYTWAFDTLKECDERENARRIAGNWGIQIREIPAEDAWPLSGYPEHGPDFDEPFMGVYQALIDRTLEYAARDGVRVLLSGDRGDLMLGSGISDLPGMLCSCRIAELVREVDTLAIMSETRRWRILRNHLIIPAAARLWPRERFPRLRSVLGRNRGDQSQSISGQRCSVLSGARRLRFRHVFSDLHMRGMVWSERTNARHGIGFADPWSDRRIAEFVLSVPQHILHRMSDQKRILKMALDGIMPEKAISNARKVSPYPLYLKALREWARSTVDDLSENMMSAELGYIDQKAFRKAVQSVRSSDETRVDIWTPLTLEMWLRKYWA